MLTNNQTPAAKPKRNKTLSPFLKNRRVSLKTKVNIPQIKPVYTKAQPRRLMPEKR